MTGWVDLSLPVSPKMPRWKVEFASTYNTSWHKASTITLPVHCGTHLDAPLHYIPGGASIETFPLDLFCCRAYVVDLTDTDANGAIGVDELASRWPSVVPPAVLLRTDWPKRAWGTSRFWSDSPYVDEAGAKWLAEQPIRIVGFDFPQDYVIRNLAAQGTAALEEFYVHLAVMSKGIWQIEYLTDLDKLCSPTVEILVCPLALEGLEASPVRVLARAAE
ncbi:MAG: cyclase family protein [Anaerolineae bacterium]